MPIARPLEFDFVARDEAATCAPELNLVILGAREISIPGGGGGLPFGVSMEQADAMDPIEPEGGLEDPFAQPPQSSNPVQPLQSPRTPGVAVQPATMEDPALQAEYAKLTAQLQALWRLKQGAENPNSVVGATIITYRQLLDGLIRDVAVETHRSLSLGLDTLDSVQDRVPGAAEAAAAQTPTKAQMAALGSMGPAEITVETPSGKVGKGTKDIYGRTGGASKEATACPLCLQQMAASKVRVAFGEVPGEREDRARTGGYPRGSAAARAAGGGGQGGGGDGSGGGAGAAGLGYGRRAARGEGAGGQEEEAEGEVTGGAHRDGGRGRRRSVVGHGREGGEKEGGQGGEGGERTGCEKAGKTKSLSDIFSSPPAKGAKGKKGKKVRTPEEFPMGSRSPGGISFEDFGGDGFNFDDADAFDLNLKSPVAWRERRPSPLPAPAPPVKKKRRSPGASKAGVGGRGGRGGAVGARGFGDGFDGALPGLATELGTGIGRGGRGGRGGRNGGRGIVTAAGLPGRGVGAKPKAPRAAKPPKEAAAPKRKKVAVKTTKAPTTAVAGLDAFDDVFGTGGALEMPGDAMVGMPDDDLELLFDGGGNRGGGGDQAFGNLFDD